MALPDTGDIARARRIIDRVRSYGVEVREMPGRERRGFRFPVAPTRVVDHHDASSRKSGEWGALGLILDGTPRGIPGPLSNAQVARCLDGIPRIAWVADGYAYHAGAGGPYAEIPKNNANPQTYGVEKANDGLGEPYTAAANYATNALFQAMAVESGAIPGSFPIGHKEWTTRKSDPVYSMNSRRAQVRDFQPATAATGPIRPEEDSVIYIINAAERPAAVLHESGKFVGLSPGTDEEKNWIAAGAKTVWVMPWSWDAYDEASKANLRLVALLEQLVAGQSAPTAPPVPPAPSV